MIRRAAPWASLLLAAWAAAGCADPFAGKVLAALPVEGEPGEADWALAVPLHLPVWKGNIHVRPEVVALDGETSHKSTAACHHGTDNSAPVPVALTALYDADELFLRAEWEDPTPDWSGASWDEGEWVREANGSWTGRPGGDDGIAFMWEGEGAGRSESAGGQGVEAGGEGFRCQKSCHMTDVGLTATATLMQMKMMAPPGERNDLWRWRAGFTAPFGLADDMVVEEAGKRGDEGQVIPEENRGDDGRPRVARVEGAGDDSPPYYLVEAPRGREAEVSASGGWRDGRYTVTFRRRLVTGDRDDRAFATAGGAEAADVPFSVAVFDHTFREHHVSAEAFRLRLAVPMRRKNEVELDPMDF